MVVLKSYTSSIGKILFMYATVAMVTMWNINNSFLWILPYNIISSTKSEWINDNVYSVFLSTINVGLFYFCMIKCAIDNGCYGNYQKSIYTINFERYTLNEGYSLPWGFNKSNKHAIMGHSHCQVSCHQN